MHLPIITTLNNVNSCKGEASLIRKEEKGILYTTLFMVLQQSRDKKMRACTGTEKFLRSGSPVGTVKQHYLPPCSSEQSETTNPYAKKTNSRSRRGPVSKTCATGKSIKDHHDEDLIKEKTNQQTNNKKKTRNSIITQ